GARRPSSCRPGIRSRCLHGGRRDRARQHLQQHLRLRRDHGQRLGAVRPAGTGDGHGRAAGHVHGSGNGQHQAGVRALAGRPPAGAALNTITKRIRMQNELAIPRRFIVLTTQRTGSSWLMDRINSVPGGEGHMELFYHSPRREPPRAGCNDYPRFVEIGARFGRRPRAVFDYLDRLYSRPGAVGFKLTYSQMRPYAETLAYILRRRLLIVHLVRRNHLDVVLSECLARKTGRFHATAEEGYRQKGVLEVDAADVARRVRRLDRKNRAFSAMLRMLPNPVHEVGYEELCTSDAPFRSEEHTSELQSRENIVCR